MEILKKTQLEITEQDNVSKKDMKSSFLALFNSLYYQECFYKVGQRLQEKLAQGKVIFPPRDCLFRAMREFELPETKVVILGQDPYHQRGQAHGLSFSVPNGIKAPPSLRNILQELHTDLKGAIGVSSSFDLSPWSRQGVLLLNTTLTVEQGAPGSHADIGWYEITLRIISSLNTKTTGVVFILWGRHAQSFAPLINTQNHHVITSPHPSSFSAHRGFFGSRPFSRANAYLKKRNVIIDWSL